MYARFFRGQIAQAIKLGLRKINVYTKLSIAAQPAMLQAINASNEPLFFHELLDIAQHAMKEAIKNSIMLLSNGVDFSNRSYEEFKPQ